MPIKKAAFKHLRQTKKRTLRNKKVKNNLRQLIKKSRKLIEAKKKDEAKEWVNKAVKALDKSAQSKIIKKNKASRLKSRLLRRLNKL